MDNIICRVISDIWFAQRNSVDVAKGNMPKNWKEIVLETETFPEGERQIKPLSTKKTNKEA
jgi:hypothetical protein